MCSCLQRCKTTIGCMQQLKQHRALHICCNQLSPLYCCVDDTWLCAVVCNSSEWNTMRHMHQLKNTELCTTVVTGHDHCGAVWMIPEVCRTISWRGSIGRSLTLYDLMLHPSAPQSGGLSSLLMRMPVSTTPLVARHRSMPAI